MGRHLRLLLGMAAIIISGIMLKKTKMFAGDPAPFVMELPAYHWPTVGNVLRSMWERGWSFIKKAGTIILLSTIVVWFTTYFGTVDGTFRCLLRGRDRHSILASIGSVPSLDLRPSAGATGRRRSPPSPAWSPRRTSSAPWASSTAAATDGTRCIAAAFTASAVTFLVFNLLCAPCFAAIGAIKREMNSAKWTWFAIGYQCGFAYPVALMIYQFGCAFTGNLNVIGLICAIRRSRSSFTCWCALQGGHEAQRQGLITHLIILFRKSDFMLNWITANLSTIVISAILLCHCHLDLSFPDPAEETGKSSCGCNCAHCAMHGQCHGKQ